MSDTRQNPQDSGFTVQKDVDKRATLDALEVLEKSRTGVVLTGRITNGKVVLDQSALDEISRKFPNAEISFVAVNAPFDPVQVPAE